MSINGKDIHGVFPGSNLSFRISFYLGLANDLHICKKVKNLQTPHFV